MSIRNVSAESAVAPNLVPMVDIMFLLLLFLMVGADMGNRELEDVRLPVAKSATEDKPEPTPEDRLTLNVFHSRENCPAYETTQLCTDRSHWSFGARGAEYSDAEHLGAFLKGLASDECARTGAPLPDLHVRIRADQAALFELVQSAMACCAEAKICKVEVGAATTAEAN
jgi:biopolymer transport protein ExbD